MRAVRPEGFGRQTRHNLASFHPIEGRVRHISFMTARSRPSHVRNFSAPARILRNQDKVCQDSDRGQERDGVNLSLLRSKNYDPSSIKVLAALIAARSRAL